MPTLFLCCSKSLEDQIEDLKKTGKKGKNAALQGLEIIDAIRSDGLSGQWLYSKRTRKGEARVDKCVKYDLGNGYRMITILYKNQLFIPFIGTHDKADLWLEHNRLDEIQTKKWLFNVEIIAQEQPDCANTSAQLLENSYTDEYEEDLLNGIDDQTLRYVFRGLVQQS